MLAPIRALSLLSSRLPVSVTVMQGDRLQRCVARLETNVRFWNVKIIFFKQFKMSRTKVIRIESYGALPKESKRRKFSCSAVTPRHSS
jgi:hypothetical protein